MISITDKYSCCGCGACATKCPNNCIEMIVDEEGFLYPRVNEEFCIECNLCVAVCPIKNNRKQKENKKPVAYAAYNNNDVSLFESSSGGLFSLLAKWILDNNGIVFGAAYNENFDVEHIAINDAKGIKRLQGSKYVQSSIGASYSQVLEYLAKGKLVLFSGTPCQVEGLHSFLGKDYKNLYTVDIVCSGVPSPQIWSKYLEYREKKSSSKISNINLRYKKYGWQEYVVLYEFENNKLYESTRFEDIYMRAFRSHCLFRPSCYECRFKSISRNSDITLADFWGIETIKPEMNNRKGTSLIFVHTAKGADILTDVFRESTFEQVDYLKAANCNPMIYQSAKEPFYRKDYFSLASKSIVKATNKYCAIPIKQKVRLVLNRLIRRIKSSLNF